MSQKIAIYCRLSEEDRDKVSSLQESESIQNQRSMLVRYALEQQWDIYQIYCDEDFSGMDADRPEWNRMIQDAQAKKFEIILCKTQSRFTRDMEMVERYLHHKFLEWNIRFIALVDHVDTGVKGGKKARQINGLVNEWYLEDLSENIRSVLDNKRRNGKYIGKIPLYGYQRDSADKNALVVDPDAAAVVRKIYRLYTEGYGITRIANQLNAEKIENPTAYKIKLGLLRENRGNSSAGKGIWSWNTVRSILVNEMYIGNMVQGVNQKVSYKSKKQVRLPKGQWMIVPNTHVPIVDAQTFLQVQARLKEHTKPQKNGKAHLFAGKVKCLFCGGSLRTSTSKQIRYLRCIIAGVDATACQAAGVRYQCVQDAVCGEVKRLLKLVDPCELEDMIHVLPQSSTRREKLRQKEKSLQKRAADLSNIIASLYQDKVNGTVSQTQFMELGKVFVGQKEQVLSELAQAQQQLTHCEGHCGSPCPLGGIIARYLACTELSRELVDAMIASIEIGKTGRKTLTLVIHWNF